MKWAVLACALAGCGVGTTGEGRWTADVQGDSGASFDAAIALDASVALGLASSQGESGTAAIPLDARADVMLDGGSAGLEAGAVDVAQADASDDVADAGARSDACQLIYMVLVCP